MSAQKKVAFYTLGCKLNFSETSTIARNFQNEGFDRVEFNEVADIYVINTCSVTDNADKRFKTIVKNALKQNEKAFLIDFLPISYRKLRRDGFMLDHITYYSNTLRPLIAERERYGKFLIRRDPRDLSRIYVDLPEQQGYLEVSYRILSHPAISLFEHRIALKRLKDTSKQHIQEGALFKAIEADDEKLIATLNKLK